MPNEVIAIARSYSLSNDIEVVGWDAAQVIAGILVRNGYQVLITTDGEIIDGKRSYMIEFVHPNWTGQSFEIVGEDE
jgi:hypothetical protein